MKAFKSFLGLIIVFVSAILLSPLMAAPGVILGGLLFTAPGGVATPFAFNLKGLPQFLTFNNVVALTSLRIETQRHGVLHDFLAASIAAINGYMCLGANGTNIVTLRLATGFMPNEDITISGVTSAAGAIGFYGMADNRNTDAVPFQTKSASILASNPTTFDNFTAIFTPAMAVTTDRCEVNYNNGHRDTYNINDLAAMSSYFQQVPGIILNNINANIHTATYTCAAATPAYIMAVKR